MKTIDVIFPAYINAPIGPSGTLRRLLNNKDYLKQRGYDLNVFSREVVSGHTIDSPVDFSSGLSKRAELKEKLKQTKLGSILFLIISKSREEEVVKAYLNLNRNPNIVVFHVTSTCYCYLRNFKGNLPKTILFHHSNGMMMDMIYKSFPKIRDSFYSKIMIKRITFADNNVDRNVFISKEGLSNFANEHPLMSKSKMVMFHNGIDDIPFEWIPNSSKFKYRLITSGTVCERKGQYIIIEALNNMNKDIREQIHLTVCGDGPELQVLKDKVKEYRLENNVHFCGYVKNTDMHQKLKENNIFILMSNNEGLPISILEAMRAGLAVISTNISGIPEEVDDRNGILLDPNIEQLTNLLNNIDKYDWDSKALLSRQRFEQEFTFSKMIESYCDMLDSLIV